MGGGGLGVGDDVCGLQEGQIAKLSLNVLHSLPIDWHFTYKTNISSGRG